MNELYIEKLLKLIKNEFITVDDIKYESYRIEVNSRLNVT